MFQYDIYQSIKTSTNSSIFRQFVQLLTLKLFYQNVYVKFNCEKRPLLQPEFVEGLLSDLEVETDISVDAWRVHTKDVVKYWSSVDS